MTTQVLVIAAAPPYQRLVRRALQGSEWRVTTCATPTAAQPNEHHAGQPLVFYAAPPHQTTARTAEDWAKLWRTLPPATPVIVLGHAGDAPHAPCTALLQGAADYLPWPVTPAQVRARAEAWRSQLRAAPPANGAFVRLAPAPVRSETAAVELPFIGASPAMVAFYRQLAQALRTRPATTGPTDSRQALPAQRPATVPTFLVTGETGTGKELVARLIHRHSPFAAGPFVAVNCSALPAELAETELFGCEVGAFTGATRARAGFWEMAAGGTLFLDEITEAPAGVLPKLLRVLEDGQVRRVGGQSWRTVSVQVIAASNRPAGAALAQGTLRADLYHRLSRHHLKLPPLRTRREDIMLLTEHFIQQLIWQEVELETSVAQVLESYAWPGNVRELKNVVHSVVRQSAGSRLSAADFQEQLAQRDTALQPTPTLGAGSDWPHAEREPWVQVQQRARELKRQTAREVLEQCAGNVTQAAAALGVSRPTFYKLLR